MLATSPPANMRNDKSICWPSPPAPTKPITTDARMAHSQRYTVYDSNSAPTLGRVP